METTIWFRIESLGFSAKGLGQPLNPDIQGSSIPLLTQEEHDFYNSQMIFTHLKPRNILNMWS